MSILALLLAAVSLSLSRANGGNDPWDPNRKFCGRLLILIAAAGESGENKGFDAADLPDPIAAYVYSDFLHFRRNDATAGPSYSIVVTSDPKLVSKLQKLPKEIIEESGFLGTVPASVDSIEELLSDDPKISLIEKAIINFSQDRNCQRAMKAGGLTSVLPLIKTEIVIEGHNRESGGVALWSTKNQAGPQSEWLKGSSLTFDAQLASKLRAKLGGGMIQAFVIACNGATAGELFQTDETPSCYVSVTDAKTLFRTGGATPPVFTFGEAKKAVAVRALEAKSSGTASMALMAASMFLHFERYVIGGNINEGFKSIFSDSKHANPLDSFCYTSADARAEKILKRCQEGRIANTRPELLLKAGFVDQLPTSLPLPAPVNPAAKRVLERVSIIRRDCRLYGEDIRTFTPPPAGDPIIGVTRKKKPSTYVSDMQFARDCADYEDPKPEMCSPIARILNFAEAGTGTTGHQTIGDERLLKATIAFHSEFKQVTAPTLVSRYESGETPLSELFEKLKSLSDKFDSFRSELWSYAEHHHKDDAEFKTAAYFMQNHFYYALRIPHEEFFPLLHNDVLEVRFVRIEEVAKLLALHGEEIGSSYRDEELRQLGNDLVCLTAFPVGPAFDAKYNEN